MSIAVAHAAPALSAIVDFSTLGKTILYSLVSGVGIAVIFGLGVTSTAGLLDALRARRTTAGAAWGALVLVCLAGAIGVIALGIVVMSSKG